MTLTGEHLVEVLADAGIEYVFGVPGGGTRMIYTAMHGRTSGPAPVLVRHEHGAAVTADAYARASGRPAVIMGQGAFIVANGAFGLMEAMTSCSPVILIGDFSDGGQTPRPVAQAITGDYGNPDAVAMMRATTKYTAVASTPREAVLGLQMAVKHAVSGCPGPTALLIKSAALAAEFDIDPGPPIYRADRDPRTNMPVPTSERIDEAIEALAGAERPVIVAGNGVHIAFAHAELAEFAERWAMPVATTYKGKSTLPESHPLALGTIGVYGSLIANDVVSKADVVVVIGAKLRNKDTSNGTVIRPEQRVIQIDIESLNTEWAMPNEVTLIGDAREVLRRLLAASEGRLPAADVRALREELVRRVRRADPLAEDPGLTADSSPVMPQRLVRLLSENLDPGTNVTLDAGNNRVWMSMFYATQRSHSLFAPGGQSGMGWAMPAAIGVKVARPEQPSLAVTGDGGFMMSVHALATAVEIPFVTVVMNDSGLGMVRQHQGNRAIASTFPPTDHAAIARGFGLEGYRVSHSKELPDAIVAAQTCGKGAVIDVVIDDQPMVDQYRKLAVSLTET